MNRMQLFAGGFLVAVILGMLVLIPQPVSAADPLKVSVVAFPNPNQDGSCPENADFEVTVVILKTPISALYDLETSVDGGKTWSQIESNSPLVIPKDDLARSFKMGFQLPIPENDRKDGKQHTYKARWIHAFGAIRTVSKPAVFVCGH